jgi:hypothetical protein
MKVLKTKFELECNLRVKDKIYFQIYIKESYKDNLRKIVKPHFHHSFD